MHVGMARRTGFAGASLALIVGSMALGCDDIHIGDSWETFEVAAVASGAAQSSEDAVRGAAVGAPAEPRAGGVAFRWDGILAESVWVDHCVDGCEDQPDDWCWNKGDDSVDGDWDNGPDEGEGVWYAGACASYSDCPGPKPEFPAGLVDGEIRFGELPPDWFITGDCSQENPELVEGEVYAVGVEGYDCSDGADNCQFAMGCRFFRMENGVPRMLDKGTR